MANFDRTRWSKKEYAYKYLEAADIQIVERRRLLEILKSFYKHFLGENKQNRVLDLGCGDGILIHELLKIDNSISGTLVDASEDMLNKAQEKLFGFENLCFIRATFKDLLHDRDIKLPRFNLIVSSFAIHHLTMDEKKSLFNYIYLHLEDGGYFLNMDVVLSPTKSLENWYLTLWKEWIYEQQTKLKSKGDYTDIIRRYIEPSHYRNIDTLADQLKALTDIGFRDVDCFYRYGIFSFYGGKK